MPTRRPARHGASLRRLPEGLDAVIQSALKQFADAQTRSRKNAVPAIFGDHNDGDPKQTFGAFLVALAQRDLKTLDALGSQFIDWSGHKAALNEQTGTQGGYTPHAVPRRSSASSTT